MLMVMNFKKGFEEVTERVRYARRTFLSAMS